MTAPTLAADPTRSDRMTPAQHYRKSQELLQANGASYRLDALAVATAAVHAQLAQIGATMLVSSSHGGTTARQELIDAVTA